MYLLEVGSEVVDGSEAELVWDVLLLDLHVVLVEEVLVVLLVGDVEHESDVERGLVALDALLLGLVVELKGVETTGFVDVEIFGVVGLLHQVIIDVHGLSKNRYQSVETWILLIVAVVEVAIRQPQVGVDLGVGDTRHGG